MKCIEYLSKFYKIRNHERENMWGIISTTFLIIYCLISYYIGRRGSIINAPRLNKMVQIINELKPDVILFAGDITEGSTTRAEIRDLAGILAKMHARFGKLAVLGNHDRPLKNDNEAQAYFKAAGITLLRDNYIKLEDSFYVIGRDDPGHRSQSRRKALSSLMSGVDTSYPLILLDHQPIGLDESRDSKIDLQLSDHTHRGQIFPSQLITGQIFEIDWGLLKKDNYHLVVSSGYGTWGPVMRIGNHPEVVSIKVKFNRK